MRLKHLFLVVLLLVVATTILASSALFAQENTTITIGMPDWMAGNFEEEMFDDFEANHPGVSVIINSVNSDLSFPIPAEFGVEDHLDGIGEYVASADVLIVTNYNMSIASTRAGYYLDMTPLVNTDPTLNESDFFPAMWQSFQWDMGIWALPISGSVGIFVYRRDAFDEAGVPYPNENWTFADLADAARALTVYDEDGEVEVPGFMAFNTNVIMRTFLGQGFYDSSTFPEMPSLDNPELAALLEDWYALEQEGVIGGFGSTQNFDFNDVPLTIQQPYNLMFGVDTDDYGGALLPGGTASLDLTGVGISAGTEQPELAYELAKYVTESVDLVSMLFNLTPARQSLVGAESDNAIGALDIPEEVQGLIDQATAGALPYSELRFSGYVDQALNLMRNDGIDAAAALQQVEEQAITDLQTAEERRGTFTVFVATPAPTPMLSADEIALQFNLNLFSSSLPNEEGWEQFIADFVAEDPQVGHVELNTSFDSFATVAEENDCFYMPYNAISSSNTTLILSLDPFFSADINFDTNDIAPGVLPQLQRDGLTYAYPMTLQPQVLWYNNEMFSEAGAFAPETGWTVSEFEDTLRVLYQANDDQAPFSGSFSGGNYILMLVAAYGGMPIDTLANPPIVNFTDPVNIEAIRQVLDLAREGLIDYDELASFGGGGGSFGNTAIYDDSISPFSFQFQISADTANDNPYRLTTYPRGSEYTPVSYGIGTGYISATAQSPEACYRFISAMAQRPDLLGGVPARMSLIDDPAYVASQPESVLDFYRGYFEILTDPNLLVLPGNFGSGDQFPGLFVLQLWMYEAFDAYVLEDGDLETELAQAQLFSEDYLQCTADIPPFNEALMTTQEEQIDYFRDFARCAVLVDPETEDFFGVILEDEE